MNQYKYAGELVQKEIVFGLESLPVGWYHTGSQGGKLAREKRRERRQALLSPESLSAEMQPMMPMMMGMPQQPVMMGQQPVMMPQQQGMPVMMSMPVMSMPMNMPYEQKAPQEQQWQKKRGWQQSEGAEQKKKPWQQWWKPEQEPDSSLEQPAKKPWWTAGSYDIQRPGGMGKNDSAEKAFEKTTRLLYAVQALKPLHVSPKLAKMHWCGTCKQRSYLGKDICITPGCKLPAALLDKLTEA